ncbi:armadillo segment polarity protein-like isoform X2 [Symsagittifera roscoffensis]|uniref:armadillo segment polarity protein-like isoform X2 n=1 Tax=Symsagittifera roscoffensis TaxID=84072 RepID=UPI00307BA281
MINDDADLVVRVAPELIRLLTSRDVASVASAQLMVNQLSKKEASRVAMAKSAPLVAAMCGSLQTANQPENCINICSTLCNMSRNSVGLLAIYSGGVIPLLVKLLGSSVEKVVFLSMTCLHNLLLHQQGAKEKIIQAGGVVKISQLFKVNNAKFLALAADSLQMLAYGLEEVKEEIASTGVLEELIRIMSSAEYEKLLWTCSRLLKVLSVNGKAKVTLVQTSAMQILGGLLTQQPTPMNKSIVSNCLWTLRNLSDVASKNDNVDNLIQKLVTFLSSGDLSWATCSSGVLSNLTCNNSRNKTVCTQVSGVQGLVAVVKLCLENSVPDMTEPAICALRHITARHHEANTAQNSVRKEGGIPLVCEMLERNQAGNNWPVIKAVIGLVRNLALAAANVSILSQCNAVMHLTGLLQYAFGILQHEASTGVAESPDAFDGVRMEEIVEWSTAALHILARNPNIRAAMRSLNVVPMLIQILFSQNENMVRVVCGLLNELSRDEEGARVIEMEGASEQLQSLVHATDTHIAAYSASVLYNILSYMDNKSSQVEHMKRLSVDLTNQMNNEIRRTGGDPQHDNLMMIGEETQRNFSGTEDQWQNNNSNQQQYHLHQDTTSQQQQQHIGMYGSDL